MFNVGKSKTIRFNQQDINNIVEIEMMYQRKCKKYGIQPIKMNDTQWISYALELAKIYILQDKEGC